MRLVNERGRQWWREETPSGQRWMRRQLLLALAVAVATTCLIVLVVILKLNGVEVDFGMLR